jgi:hypothetical protein
MLIIKCVVLWCNRLYNQSIRQRENNNATEPARDTNEAVAYMTIERKSNYLKIPKDMASLNNRLLNTEEYCVIDVNTYMDGLDTTARYRFINKVKVGLAVPFQIWSCMKGNNCGVATHHILKIPPKTQHQARADGETKSADIVGEMPLFMIPLILTCVFSVATSSIFCFRVPVLLLCRTVVAFANDFHGL